MLWVEQLPKTHVYIPISLLYRGQSLSLKLHAAWQRVKLLLPV
jgi:hypothetical protein